MSSVNWWCFGCRRCASIWRNIQWLGWSVLVPGVSGREDDWCSLWSYRGLATAIMMPPAASTTTGNTVIRHTWPTLHLHHWLFCWGNLQQEKVTPENFFKCLMQSEFECETQTKLMGHSSATARLKKRLQWSWWQRLLVTRFQCSNEAGSWCECCVPAPDNSHLTLTFHLPWSQ